MASSGGARTCATAGSPRRNTVQALCVLARSIEPFARRSFTPRYPLLPPGSAAAIRALPRACRQPELCETCGRDCAERLAEALANRVVGSEYCPRRRELAVNRPPAASPQASKPREAGEILGRKATGKGFCENGSF